VPDPACPGAAYGPLGNAEDAWFKVTVPANGEVTFDTDDQVLTDLGMAIYEGPNCSDLTYVTCDDNSSGNGPQLPFISLTGRFPGETLWIRIWEEGNNAEGTFDLCAYRSDYEMDDVNGNSISDCTGKLFDSGGSGSDYTANEYYTLLINPPGMTSITLEFITFQVEAHASCGWDYLAIYNGTSTSDPLLDKFCDTGNPPDMTPSVEEYDCSSLFIVWYSDNDQQRDGFEMNWQANIDVNAYVSQEIACNGDNDGEITAISSGGAPITYSWTPDSETTQTITNKIPGLYTVDVDANGCIGSDNVTLTQPDVLSVSHTSLDPTCSGDCDGQTTANPIGGTGTISYSWVFSYSKIAFIDDPVAPNTINDGAGLMSFPLLVSDLNITYELDSVCVDIDHYLNTIQ